jgi:hypothetical protein
MAVFDMMGFQKKETTKQIRPASVRQFLAELGLSESVLESLAHWEAMGGVKD